MPYALFRSELKALTYKRTGPGLVAMKGCRPPGWVGLAFLKKYQTCK